MGKRRASGDGCVYQDKDGFWHASIDLGMVNGKRKRKKFYAKTRKEVVEKMKAAQKEQESGRNLAIETQTVAGFLARWLDTVVEQTRKPTTISSYRLVVRRYINPKIG